MRSGIFSRCLTIAAWSACCLMAGCENDREEIETGTPVYDAPQADPTYDPDPVLEADPDVGDEPVRLPSERPAGEDEDELRSKDVIERPADELPKKSSNP